MAEKRWGVNNSTVVFLADFIRSVLGTTGPIPGAQLDPQLREAVAKVESGGGGSSADLRYVTFMDHTGTVELGKKAVAVGDDCADPIARGLFDTPTRESDAQYNYAFVGWANTPGGGWDENALKAIVEDKTVYAAYAGAVRSYTISYYDGDTLLKSETLTYGSMPNYVAEKEGANFEGWEPEFVTVTSDANYYAQFSEKLTFAGASWADIARISEAGEASTNFALGDTREMDGAVYEIIAFGHDVKNDGTKVGMTIAVKVPNRTRKIGDYSNANNGGYTGSTIFSNSTNGIPAIYNSLPEELRVVIKSVKKISDKPTSSANKLETSYLNIWLFSHNEVFGDSIFGLTGQGEIYEWFEDVNNRVKKNTSGTACEWWLRSTASSTKAESSNASWCYVDATGALSAGNPNTSKYVVFGFCI